MLLIRADASAQIGTGHVMRCISLAQSWKQVGGRAMFAMANGAQDLKARLLSAGFEVVMINTEPGSAQDAEQTLEIVRTAHCSWLAVDGFHFSAEYCARLHDARCCVLLVDDDGTRAPYRSDVVVNVNPQASESLYCDRGSATKLLLGPKYALLRQEFVAFDVVERDVPKTAKKLLVSFGGSDPHNVSRQVLAALADIRDIEFEVTVIVGASNPHLQSLKEAAAQSGRNIELLIDVQNMPATMAKSDLAITAAGGTCFELAFMNVPMLLIPMAYNHEPTVAAWGRLGAALTSQWFESLTKDVLVGQLRTAITDGGLRKRARDVARNLVDGMGADRVVATMLAVESGRHEASSQL